RVTASSTFSASHTIVVSTIAPDLAALQPDLSRVRLVNSELQGPLVVSGGQVSLAKVRTGGVYLVSCTDFDASDPYVSRPPDSADNDAAFIASRGSVHLARVEVAGPRALTAAGHCTPAPWRWEDLTFDGVGRAIEVDADHVQDGVLALDLARVRSTRGLRDTT